MRLDVSASTNIEYPPITRTAIRPAALPAIGTFGRELFTPHFLEVLFHGFEETGDKVQ
jgi:hypothetical protein